MQTYNIFEFWIYTEKLPYLQQAGIKYEVTNVENNQSRIKVSLTNLDIPAIFHAGVQNGIDLLSAEYKNHKTIAA